LNQTFDISGNYFYNCLSGSVNPANTTPISIIFTLILLFSYTLWRLKNSCDSVLSILGSVAIGLLFGGLVHLLHVYLFGRDSINMLGLPLLADRAANGGPLYVCAKDKK
jgi:hypothetical protein